MSIPEGAYSHYFSFKNVPCVIRPKGKALRLIPVVYIQIKILSIYTGCAVFQSESLIRRAFGASDKKNFSDIQPFCGIGCRSESIYPPAAPAGSFFSKKCSGRLARVYYEQKTLLHTPERQQI